MKVCEKKFPIIQLFRFTVTDSGEQASSILGLCYGYIYIYIYIYIYK